MDDGHEREIDFAIIIGIRWAAVSSGPPNKILITRKMALNSCFEYFAEFSG